MSNYSKKIIIDASYSDEIRSVVLKEGKVIEFDQELKNKTQLKGNIYTAIVKRIEPSLQAVFIEFGKDKQGFLSFSEIAIEYYQIPEEEKQRLLENYYINSDESKDESKNDTLNSVAEEKNDSSVESNHLHEKSIDIKNNDDKVNNIEEENNNSSDSEVNNTGNSGKSAKKDLSNDVKPKYLPPYKKYKVQDVIHIGQQVMVQLIKEERGTKGPSFSTYITLVGRYCIFMPNSGNKSGISRRIDDATNRKNLKEILESIRLPERAGIIIRTAGANKTIKELEQDLFYLQSLWQSIQNNSSSVQSASLLYIEGDIIKRTLRDFCDEHVKEVIVSGQDAYEATKQCVKFMFRNKLRIRLYKGNIPIFAYYKIEEQISQLYSNLVKLPSGGYIIITPTEALVSIDVNSGRMTGEDSIEETAYKTNMEAVKEIAHQINLRGLSGLIVIDFIDMLKYRYCRAVESRIKEEFKNDRARIQFGYISAFGLMEISRQRVKQSVLEISTIECPHCKGVGKVRSPESISSLILRDLHYNASKNHNKVLSLHANEKIITYIFNHKRPLILEIEQGFGVALEVVIDNTIDFNDFYIKVTREIKNNDIDKDTINSFTISYKNNNRPEENTSTSNKEINANKSGFWLKRWFAKILNKNFII